MHEPSYGGGIFHQRGLEARIRKALKSIAERLSGTSSKKKIYRSYLKVIVKKTQERWYSWCVLGEKQVDFQSEWGPQRQSRLAFAEHIVNRVV